MKTKSLDFWFEFASTYSYLAAMRIDSVAREAGVEVHYRPFLMGPIFRTQGWDAVPFTLSPAKERYMWRDVERRAAAHGFPFRRPEKFPVYSLYATRIALLAENEDWSLPFIRSVYRANFVDGLDTGDPECLEQLLIELGIDGATVLRDSSGAAVKDALRNRTGQAMDLNIFGAPTFVVGDELFWGDDRLEDAIEAALTAPLEEEQTPPAAEESVA